MYQLITDLRNYLFDIGYKRSVCFDLPVINVGNLRVGGTGKTPMVAYIADLLLPTHKIGIVSRGYGRKTKGFLLANETITATQIGDEPMLLWQKLKEKGIKVAVGEQRIEAIPNLLFECPQINTIVLDDAFQHRYVKPSLNILLTTYAHPFYKDKVLPFGRLRESRKGAKRADIVIVTKCPETLSNSEKDAIQQQIQLYTKTETPIFFTTIQYEKPLPIFENNTKKLTEKDKIILFSGIADDSLLLQFANSRYDVRAVKSFADHYAYQTDDLEALLQLSETHQAVLLTTEKDMIKLKTSPQLAEISCKMPVFYVPIGVKFLQDEALFQAILRNHVAQMQEQRSENS